jgi:hypothetical protein
MRVLAVAGCGVMGVSLSACESTEQESAKLSREGQHLASSQGTLALGAPNRTVHVSHVTLLSGEGRNAVALQLNSSSTRAQANVPVLVRVTDAHGKLLYSNAAGGLEPSLQHVGLVAARGAVWWVNDQVLGSATASGVSARVGAGSSPRGVPARLVVSGVHQTRAAGQPVITGTVRNLSTSTLERLPVFAVALRGGRPVAAGRAVIESLPAHSGRGTSFQIFLVGDPAGAQLVLDAVAPGA